MMGAGAERDAGRGVLMADCAEPRSPLATSYAHRPIAF
jgi:hypothetical protein